ASLQRISKLPAETLILPGHVSQPVAFDGIPLVAPLSEAKKGSVNLDLPVREFAAWVLSRIPPTPPNHHEIIRFNEKGHWPEDAPAELEAGANRCAVS